MQSNQPRTGRARRAAPKRPVAKRPAPKQLVARRRGTRGILALTLLAALVPGTGYLFAGRKKLGALVLTIWAGLLAVLGYLGLTQRDQLIAMAVDPRQLRYVTIGLCLLGALWVLVIVTSHRALRPGTLSHAGRFVGALFVGGLSFAVAVPTAVGMQTVQAQRELVRTVFSDKDSKSATRPTVKNKKDPWAGQPRLNVLLLGADDAAKRQGVRTDTVIVASIDTRTGAVSLISLPRKLMFMPFPAETKLHEVYPNGFGKDGISKAERLEWMLDAMYRNIPAKHRDIVGPSDNVGADILKLSVGEATGLKLDYYVQINLAGFTKLVDALGGIRVNINYPIPVGGSDDDKRPPNYYLQPGRDVHLMGPEALWYARGRYGLANPDDARSARQRCAINAIAETATPANVLKSYQELASVGKNMLRTDIPQDLLPAFVDLGQKVKSAKVSEVPLDGRKLKFAYPHPDYDGLRKVVATALATEPVKPTKPRGTAPTRKPAKRPTAKKPTADLADACAYHPRGN